MLDTPTDVSASPLSSCDSTTCVHDLSPGAPPYGIRRRNRRTAPHGNHRAARSNLAGCTTDAEKSFCCVTTRRRAEPFRPTETRRPVAAWERAGGDLVLPRRASDGPPAPPAALAAASLPASDAPPAGKRGPDSIAGSTAVPDRAVHSPWQGKIAIPAVPPWSDHPHRRYAVNDPWESIAPLGQPGEDVRASSSGTYPLVLRSVRNRPLAIAFPHAMSSAKKRGTPKKVDMMLTIDRAVVNRPEGDKEGHVPDMRGLEEDLGRRQARRKEDYRTALTAPRSSASPKMPSFSSPRPTFPWPA